MQVIKSSFLGFEEIICGLLLCSRQRGSEVGEFAVWLWFEVATCVSPG